jgi:hypothetical protein
MALGEVGWGDMDWIGLAQDRTGGELLWIRYSKVSTVDR